MWQKTKKMQKLNWLAYYNTSKKLAEGKPLIYGEDLVFNVNDLDKVESGSFAYNLR